MKQNFAIIVALALFGLSCDNDDAGNGDCIEEKKDSCIVTFELNPVCGCNGVTYPNPSTAECHGIDDFTMGECN